MSQHQGPAAAAEVAAAGPPSFVHLRSPGCSLLPEVPEPGPAGTSPRVVHWGPALRSDLDAAALVQAVSTPIAVTAPDDPIRRDLLPLPVDGWRLRPGLRGARADGTAWSPLFTVRAVDSDVGQLGDEGGGGWALGEVLMRVGLQLPVLNPEQALILHLAEA